MVGVSSLGIGFLVKKNNAASEGCFEGYLVGDIVIGAEVGVIVGISVGFIVGFLVGWIVGSIEGFAVGDVGAEVVIIGLSQIVLVEIHCLPFDAKLHEFVYSVLQYIVPECPHEGKSFGCISTSNHPFNA